ncbi:MAG: substrate-binding domain-containing protein [Candidatus Hydrogenedentes bacterium]|nr:substrate-binding domain-containing protein [Candidatus Hydrogenedentota bacterium]
MNEGIASKLLEELNALGFTVPGEVELAVIDDNRLAETLGIPMLTAEQTGYEMGRECAEILLARVASPDLPPQQRYMDAKLTLDRIDSRPEVAANENGSV